MGIFRFLLALSVVALHCNSILGNTMVGGLIAVQCFYIISGYYMAMVLTTKYAKSKKPYSLFISNRALKLYPTYYVLLIGTILLIAASSFAAPGSDLIATVVAKWNAHSTTGKVIGVVTNLSLLGQDLIFLVNQAGDKLVFTSDYHRTGSLHDLMIIPQAWTVGLEITFYLIAPFLVKLKKPYLLVLAIILLITRIYFYYQGYTGRPWNYQFFPFELFFFTVGMLTYKYSEALLRIPKKIVYPLIGVIVYMLFVHFQFFADNWTTRSIFYAISIILIPFLFELTKRSKLDRAVGELSYPIYMCHLLAAFIVNYFISGNNYFFGFTVTLLAIAMSVAINKLIQDPIERYRQRRVKTTDTVQPL